MDRITRAEKAVLREAFKMDMHLATDKNSDEVSHVFLCLVRTRDNYQLNLKYRRLIQDYLNRILGVQIRNRGIQRVLFKFDATTSPESLNNMRAKANLLRIMIFEDFLNEH